MMCRDKYHIMLQPNFTAVLAGDKRLADLLFNTWWWQKNNQQLRLLNGQKCWYFSMFFPPLFEIIFQCWVVVVVQSISDNPVGLNSMWSWLVTVSQCQSDDLFLSKSSRIICSEGYRLYTASLNYKLSLDKIAR